MKGYELMEELPLLENAGKWRKAWLRIRPNRARKAGSISFVDG